MCVYVDIYVCVCVYGALTIGVLKEDALTNGVFTNGVLMYGALMYGALADGALKDGALTGIIYRSRHIKHSVLLIILTLTRDLDPADQ